MLRLPSGMNGCVCACVCVVYAGVQHEVSSTDEQQATARAACALLFELGALPIFIQGLLLAREELLATPAVTQPVPTAPRMRRFCNLLCLFLELNADNKFLAADLSTLVWAVCPRMCLLHITDLASGWCVGTIVMMVQRRR